MLSCSLHLGQSWKPNHLQIPLVLLFRSDRPMIGAGDDDLSIQNHDFIVCPGMPCIEGYIDPRRDQACDGREGRMMRLRSGIEEDVDLNAPMVGTHQHHRQPGSI
jgi:hypothetical protein